MKSAALARMVAAMAVSGMRLVATRRIGVVAAVAIGSAGWAAMDIKG